MMAPPVHAVWTEPPWISLHKTIIITDDEQILNCRPVAILTVMLISGLAIASPAFIPSLISGRRHT